MGLLTKGSPLSWAETVPHIEYIKVGRHSLCSSHICVLTLFHHLHLSSESRILAGGAFEDGAHGNFQAEDLAEH
ncbi:hypothetical protein Y032_0084g1748 [Ancylostoma ceylanicum]|uniref:Uncharacterized protein n=1 Tax=Ancylostoma ceylanicum TaxID=53326 RepID=A0A016TRP3_9BILA|nr:hypothetical protein Y032_0084g1748 [Ancylostoma ceylanicum]